MTVYVYAYHSIMCIFIHTPGIIISRKWLNYQGIVNINFSKFPIPHSPLSLFLRNWRVQHKQANLINYRFLYLSTPLDCVGTFIVIHLHILNHFERCRNRTRIPLLDFFKIFQIIKFSKNQLTGAKKHPKKGPNYATSQT